ncbi:MAG TPA: RNA chaperone Hfq [Bacillota bacterium]|nr:RNA chaperone Hfq [Bacillota bacterium]
MTQSKNIQDFYLNELRKSKSLVTVFLTNGFQLRGTIHSFDSYTVLLESDNKQQLIYKHAISTFVPNQNVSFE